MTLKEALDNPVVMALCKAHAQVAISEALKDKEDRKIITKEEMKEILGIKETRFQELIAHENFPLNKAFGSGQTFRMFWKDFYAWLLHPEKGYGRFNF